MLNVWLCAFPEPFKRSAAFEARDCPPLSHMLQLANLNDPFPHLPLSDVKSACDKLVIKKPEACF